MSELLNNSEVIEQGTINSQYSIVTSKTKRKFLQRAFGRLHYGSLRSAIFILMASAMGTGVFTFPWIAKNTGLAFLLIYIVTAGLCSMTSMYLLMSSAKPNNITSYNELANLAYGKSFKRLSEFCVIIYAWGITVCFQVVFAKFVVEIVAQIFDLDVFQNLQTNTFNSFGDMIRLLTNAGGICVNMIFIFKKDLYSLRFITILGTGAIVYNSLVILVTAFIGFKYDKAGETHDVLSIISPDKDYSSLKWANFDNPWLQLVGFASTIFCYVNHQMVFPISQELANPTFRRLHKIFDRAHISQALIYMVVGVMGYLLLFQEKHIDSIALQSITTTPILIGKMLILITLFFAVPLNMLPARQMLFTSFAIERTKRNHIVVCILLAASSCGIAMGFVNVTTYFGLLGGTAGTMIAGTIPALCYLKLTPRKLSDPKCIIVMVLFSIMTICGFTGAFAAVFAVNQ